MQHYQDETQLSRKDSNQNILGQKYAHRYSNEELKSMGKKDLENVAYNKDNNVDPIFKDPIKTAYNVYKEINQISATGTDFGIGSI